MFVAIIDYGSGNLRSAAKAFERAALEAHVNTGVQVTDRPDVVAGADRIVLPGVGAFADCKCGLLAINGMVEALTEAVIAKARPFLGICVGMQLMAREGREHGRHPGLGWIDGVVMPVRPADPALKVPHMGWNDLEIAAPAHPLLAGLSAGQHAYFVHSYHMALEAPDLALSTVCYGGTVTAMVGRDNLAGTQFHPEKSQATGLRLITNFLRWTP